MIILLCLRGHGYTMRSLVEGKFGAPVPRVRTMEYEQLYRAFRLPRATYVFSDIERMHPWELRLAAELHRTLTGHGMRCLNDPARAMARVELLAALHAAGVNPFKAYRADERPRPERFPVFLRSEVDHDKASNALYADQAALDAALKALPERGMPLRGMLVVELAAQPYRENRWVKWGTYRVGDHFIPEHIAVDDNWLVKIGQAALIDEAAAADEHAFVHAGVAPREVEDAFAISGIEFGRADHAVVGSGTVIYEINTCPYLPVYLGTRPPVRLESQLHSRRRLADALAAIDTPEGPAVSLGRAAWREKRRWWRPGFRTPGRP